MSPGLLLALAYPDRVAKARGAGSGQYLLANGRGAALEPSQRLAREALIVVAEMTGAAQQARILAAAAITEAEIATARRQRPRALRHGGAHRDQLRPQRPRAARSRAVRRYGALSLSERPLPAEAYAGKCRGAGEGHRRRSASACCPGRRRSSSCASASTSCAGPPRAPARTSPGPTSPMPGWRPSPDAGSRRISSGAPRSPRSTPADLDAALGAPAALGAEAPARCRGADAFRRADRLQPRRRLRRRGRPDDLGARAGALRPVAASRARRRPRAAGAGAALAGAPADPGHARPAGLLARLMGGGEDPR